MAGAAGLFGHLSEAPADPIMGMAADFKRDTTPKKINLAQGAYRTAEGAPYVLPAVLQAEEAVLADLRAGRIDKEYAPIDGHPLLKELGQKVALGDCAAVREGRVFSAQALSGTGALRLLADFSKRFLPVPSHTIYVSDPTWPVHKQIFEAGGLEVRTYPYWDPAARGIDGEAMLAALRGMPEGSLVLLHACAHNPTGMDPSEELWERIADVLSERHLVPCVDSAYQGYASGDLERDALCVRLFERRGLEFFIMQSFAKNIGLYGERVGMLHAVCRSKEAAVAALSQLKLVIRSSYSSPPIHGAHLVMKILGDAALYEQWKRELKGMADRIVECRRLLRDGLERKGCPGTWKHLTEQIGMFSYTGLTQQQCETLTRDHHIYLQKTGRIAVPGLNPRNIEYMVDCVDAVVRSSKL